MTTQNTSHDDIDLIGLLERIYLFFRRFRTIFLVAILCGLLLGSASYFLAAKLYESKLILHSSYLTNQEELEIIDYWNQLLARNQRAALAPILNCREPLLNNLVRLEASEIQKNYSSTDPNGFYIVAKVKDNSILAELQTAIVFGLNNNEFAKQKITEKQQSLSALIEKTARTVARMDTIKNEIEQNLMHDSKNASPSALNLQYISADAIDLDEKLLNYKTSLGQLSAVQVLQGFIPLNTPVSRSLSVSLIMGLVLGLAVAYIFCVLKYIEDRLKKRVSNA